VPRPDPFGQQRILRTPILRAGWAWSAPSEGTAPRLESGRPSLRGRKPRRRVGRKRTREQARPSVAAFPRARWWPTRDGALCLTIWARKRRPMPFTHINAGSDICHGAGAVARPAKRTRSLLLYMTLAIAATAACGQPSSGSPSGGGNNTPPAIDPAIVTKPPLRVDPRAVTPPPRQVDPEMVERPPVRPPGNTEPARPGSSERSRADDCRGSAQDCKQNSAR
jgi:hypothetical protein